MVVLTILLQAKSAMWEARHKVESNRVRTMVLSLSGYYVKAAQVISVTAPLCWHLPEGEVKLWRLI